MTAGGTAQTLSPTFSSTVTDYTVAVANTVTQITIEATPDGDVTVAYQNTDGTTLTDADTNTAGQQSTSAGDRYVDIITDAAGNDEQLTSAATGAVAAVVKPLLTATVHGVPSSHNGQDAFTFELRFSEAPEPDFSYRTVRDHAFTVNGGSVTYVRRLEPGKNIRWEITVTPDSSADVTIALNVTTDCEAAGAICTEDGRKLSAPLELTVNGPRPAARQPGPCRPGSHQSGRPRRR